MLEYLKCSLRPRTAPSPVAIAVSRSSSGNGCSSCQWSQSRPSRMTPPWWPSSSRTVASASAEPASAGTHRPTGSSSRIRPASTSCRTAMAVNVLECDAMRNRWPVVSRSPVSTSATPSAVSSTSRSPTRTAACTPGTRARRRWWSSQDSRYGARSAATSAVSATVRLMRRRPPHPVGSAVWWAGRVQQWSVVVPAKRLALAKTRLRPLTDGAPVDHADVVLALLADTVAAALDCPRVERVLVVTDDPAAAETVRALGAGTVADEPDEGLNPALAHGALSTGAAAVAALSSDLPALRPEELAAALDAAGTAPRCFVADAEGTGTTLLTALGVPLDPRFGAGSAAAHRASGAVPLAGTWHGLATDVDTEAALRAALALGVGPATAAVAARLGVASPCR